MTDALRSVRSYLVHAAPGERAAVAAAIAAWPGCEALAAESHDVVIVVAEAASREDEDALDARLAALDHVLSASLVSGFRDE